MEINKTMEKLEEIGITKEAKVRMYISDITREGSRLAITVGINNGEITLFNFDEEREFPLWDLILSSLKELSLAEEVFKGEKKKE
jgi:hypothetical protein